MDWLDELEEIFGIKVVDCDEAEDIGEADEEADGLETTAAISEKGLLGAAELLAAAWEEDTPARSVE